MHLWATGSSPHKDFRSVRIGAIAVQAMSQGSSSYRGELVDSRFYLFLAGGLSVDSNKTRRENLGITESVVLGLGV